MIEDPWAKLISKNKQYHKNQNQLKHRTIYDK